MGMDYNGIYRFWRENPYFDDETKRELDMISDNEKEIEDRFYRELEFGTGGLRGVIGAGTNRLNKYMVRKVSQGLANYLLKQFSDTVSIAVAYDSRRLSVEFAYESACVFAANGMKCYLFDALRPTPELSFAVRQLGCQAGVVITASHNPKQYNGYKVYGEDGGQLPLDASNAVYEEMKAISDLTALRIMEKETAIQKGLIEIIGSKMDTLYLNAIKTQRITFPDQNISDQCRIVYTPLHGAGNKLVRRILKETGFQHVFVVPEQENPDPNFSTVDYPNPEEKAVFKLAVELAEKKKAELIIGTDPDCDRVGVVVKNQEGEFVTLTGNQVGCLLLEYILINLKQQNKLPQKGFVVKTIVTTALAEKIAAFHHVNLVEVLTGFKFIGEQIRIRDEQGDETFIFGFEESYGYLAGTYARDKDAVVASMLIAEMFAWYKSRGMTLYDGLIELYEKYGYEKEGLESFSLLGKTGIEKIQNALDLLRKEGAGFFENLPIKAIRDYKTGIRTESKTGAKRELGLPESDVLFYETQEGSWFCIRPSGTEPKIKIYFGVSADSIGSSEKVLSNLQEQVLLKIHPYLR